MPTACRTAPASSAGSFRALTAALEERGLLRRRPGAYLAIVAANVALVAVGVAAFVLLGSSWWQLVPAGYWRLVSTQLAFVGHDAGHRQILATRRANDVVGYLHGALVGMSYGTWIGQHNRHHARPNHAGDDPDIDIPLLAFGAEQAARTRGVLRWAVAHQAALFLPLLLLEGWSLHLTAARSAWRGDVRRPRLELGLLAGHVLGYTAAVLAVLTPVQALAFVVVHQGVWGVSMGLAFAPDHKGMPIIEPGRKLDHLHKQVLTARNVRGGPLTDVLLGGLNHQIEHHLFPWMPRPNLARARVVVRAFCTEHDLPYTETTLTGSYVAVLRHLHAVGAPLRGGRRVDGRAGARTEGPRAPAPRPAP